MMPSSSSMDYSKQQIPTPSDGDGQQQIPAASADNYHHQMPASSSMDYNEQQIPTPADNHGQQEIPAQSDDNYQIPASSSMDYNQQQIPTPSDGDGQQQVPAALADNHYYPMPPSSSMDYNQQQIAAPADDGYQIPAPSSIIDNNQQQISTPLDDHGLQQEIQAPSHIDYHTDFEFDHHDSPPTSEHDAISHERLPSSDSFKEEEVNKPLDEYSKLKSGESFLKHDTGMDDPDRILFFTTQKNLEHLKASAYWGINCVSKKVPRPFVHCWVIHGFYRLKAIPFVYILVRSTKETTFERAMKLLPEDVLPRHVMMDYNRKEYQLAQTLFPEARFHLCYFYFTCSVMRKIANSHWVTRYRTDEQFHIDVKSFMMLSFVKPADVIRYFNVLKEAFNGIYPESLNLNEFYGYMEEKWIGNPDAGVAPEYPIELWNVYDSTFNQYPRTNNFFKTWLSRYYTHFRCGIFWEEEQPVTVHAFIDEIKMEQNVNEFNIRRLDVGMDLPHFGKINEDMLKIVKYYDKYEPLDYLRAISAASVAPPRSEKRRHSAANNQNSPMSPATNANAAEENPATYPRLPLNFGRYFAIH